MAAFIDLMGYARGAELANQENWRDVSNDINTRAAEERLRQSQITFDTDLPGYQFGKETALDQGLGARRGVEFQVGVLSEMNKLPPEQQAEFLANSFRSRLSNIAPTPGGAQELNALRDMVTMQANKFLAAGDTRSAQSLFSAIPGVGQAQADQRGEVEKWSNPQTAFDEMNLATGAAQVGGKYDPQTKTIDLAGIKYDVPRFAQYMRDLALNRFADRTPGMLSQQERQIKLDEGDRIVELYRQNGWAATKDPITGAVTPRFRLQDGQPATPETAATGVNQMSYAPGMQPLQLSNTMLPQYAGPGSTGPTLPMPAVAAVPAAPVMPTAAAVPATPVDGAAFNPQVVAQTLDQATQTRVAIENALRTLLRQQETPNTPEARYYQQELAKAKQVEAQAKAKAQADALAGYMQTLQQQGYVPGRPFTPWLTQPGAPR